MRHKTAAIQRTHTRRKRSAYWKMLTSSCRVNADLLTGLVTLDRTNTGIVNARVSLIFRNI